MTAEVINKINITAEAVFDYEEALDLGRLDRRALKAEAEDYIDFMNKGGRLLYAHYFRCRYLDEDSGQTLMLFLYRAERLSVMQYWNLAGVCLAEDWTEDAEDDGTIRRWLKAKITDLEKGDWVIEQQARAFADKILSGGTVQGSIQGLPGELTYAIEHGTNQELAEALSVLQGAGGKRAWRGVAKKEAAIPRNVDKCPKRGGLQTNKSGISRRSIGRKGG
jgi:hypothetical protein